VSEILDKKPTVLRVAFVPTKLADFWGLRRASHENMRLAPRGMWSYIYDCRLVKDLDVFLVLPRFFDLLLDAYLTSSCW
jgi:hypothetical protein